MRKKYTQTHTDPQTQTVKNCEPRSNDFLPTATISNLRRRAELLGKLRSFFTARDFFEVTTPLLSRDTVVDRHLDPFAVVRYDDPRRPERGPIWYLQTSPEFHMKRLLVAGADAIFQVTQAFRAAEFGRLHNIEFTIAEWYRRGDDMQAGIQLLSELVDHLLSCGPARRMAYREAFRVYADFDPAHEDQRSLQQRIAAQHGPPANLDFDGCLDWIFVAQVQPRLNHDQPTIIYDYPASQSALALIRDDESPAVSERFELFFQGVELANGYHELLDPNELQQRILATLALRKRDGKAKLPAENRLLDAMHRGLPACTGVALGFDRLAMLATGCESLAEVMPFPADRA
jgi:lysyl-tRNA synthetase class 2